MIQVGDYFLDAAITEEHSFENEITEFPVESGAMVADHVQVKPDWLTFEFIVSDTPLGDVLAKRAGDLIDPYEELLDPYKTLPSEEALAFLLAVRNSRETITIVTGIRTYDDMICESLKIPQDASTGHALKGTATFKQVQIITNERVVIKTAQPRGQKKRRLGSKSAPNFTGAVMWLCPPGVSVITSGGFNPARDHQANLQQGCEIVRQTRGSDGVVRWRKADGTEFTDSEITSWKDEIETRSSTVYDPHRDWTNVHTGQPLSRSGLPSHQPGVFTEPRTGVLTGGNPLTNGLRLPGGR